MPVTLEEAKKNTQDKLSPLVIDEFRKNNFLMNTLLPLTTAFPRRGEGQP